MYNSMGVKYSMPIEMPETSQEVREGLGACGRARLVGLGADDKIAFLDYYTAKREGGGYSKKEKKK
jgi:hypothetical protein